MMTRKRFSLVMFVSVVAGLASERTSMAAALDNSGMTAAMLPRSMADDPRVVVGLSRPSEDRHISFEGGIDGTAVIKEVKLKEGDRVKAGDEIMREDTTQAQDELAVLEAGANATGAITEAQTKIEGYDKILQSLKDANASGREITETTMNRDTAAAQKTQAQDDHRQKQLAFQKQKDKIEHMILRSPIDGIIRRINLKAGEVVDANSNKEGVCEVVKNDPLWVEISLPPAQAGKLKKDDAVQICFPDEIGKWRDAKVDFRDPVIESGSNTQMVRFTLPNPEVRDAGLNMIVRLPADLLPPNTTIGAATP